jgi:flagella basal body P-ring formation protein FlgA
MKADCRKKGGKMSKQTGFSCKCIIGIYMVLIFSFILHPDASIMASSWSLENTLKSFLDERYPWEDIEISNIKVVGDLKDVAPDVIVVEKGPIGRAIFSFRYNKERKVIVKAFVRAFGNVVKSKRPFRKGHVINSDDIYIDRMDIRKMPHGSVKIPELLIGKSLRRSVIANIPLIEDMVEYSQAVKRGKNVILLINKNGLKITAVGRTKEKAYIGSPVKAVNISSKKEVMGVLVDENTVEVLL